MVNAILTSKPVEQQTYRSCMGFLKPAGKYSDSRLEAACKKALSFTALPSYKSISNILAARFGATKEDSTKPQVNLAVAVSQTNTTPLYYDLFPGSIIDLTEYVQLINQLHVFGY